MVSKADFRRLEDTVQALVLGLAMQRAGMSSNQAAVTAPLLQQGLDSVPFLGPPDIISPQEYLSRVDEFARMGTAPISRRLPKTKKKRKPLKGMSAAMREANSKARKKNGQFRMGWDHAKLMKTAHKIRRSKSGTKGRRR